jgi:hypothetical protein
VRTTDNDCFHVTLEVPKDVLHCLHASRSTCASQTASGKHSDDFLGPTERTKERAATFFATFYELVDASAPRSTPHPGTLLLGRFLSVTY